MYFEELEKQFIQIILKSKHTDLPEKSISWYAGCRQTRKTVLQNQLYIQNNTTKSLHGSKNPQISPHMIMTTHSCAHGTNSTLESNSWNVKERMLEMWEWLLWYKASCLGLNRLCLSEAVHVLQSVDGYFNQYLTRGAQYLSWKCTKAGKNDYIY